MIDETDYIKANEFHYCHRCGIYLLPHFQMSQMICYACQDSENTSQAKINLDLAKFYHSVVSETRTNITKVRQKYTNTNVWLNLRKSVYCKKG